MVNLASAGASMDMHLGWAFISKSIGSADMAVDSAAARRATNL